MHCKYKASAKYWYTSKYSERIENTSIIPSSESITILVMLSFDIPLEGPTYQNNNDVSKRLLRKPWPKYWSCQTKPAILLWYDHFSKVDTCELHHGFSFTLCKKDITQIGITIKFFLDKKTQSQGKLKLLSRTLFPGGTLF